MKIQKILDDQFDILKTILSTEAYQEGKDNFGNNDAGESIKDIMLNSDNWTIDSDELSSYEDSIKNSGGYCDIYIGDNVTKYKNEDVKFVGFNCDDVKLDSYTHFILVYYKDDEILYWWAHQ